MSGSALPRIAVALSGGGYRAAAFSAGVILYLIDSGRAAQITAISSVSGGSITNAYFARNVLTNSSDGPQDPWASSAPLFAFLARRDILSPVRMLAITVLLAVPTALVAAFSAYSRGTTVASSVATGVMLGLAVVVTVLAILFLQLRRSLELAIEWLLRLPGTGRIPRKIAVPAVKPSMTLLAELATSYSPIFCCTDLATGSQFYLSPSFVAGIAPSVERSSSSINVSGFAAELPVAAAVAASAAFPLVFRPTVISSTTLGLPVRRGVIDDRIVLADGGLFDNLGVSVVEAWINGEMSSSVLQDLGSPPEVTVVVDCGQPAHQRQSKGGLIRRVMRSMDIVHQANSLARRREMERQFRSGDRVGTLISIDDDPFAVAANSPDPVRAESVESWLAVVGRRHRITRTGWRAISQQSSPAIATNLRKLGPSRVVQLVLHGYAATMARTVIELGWDTPSADHVPESLARLCTDPFVGSLIDRAFWAVGGGATMDHMTDSSDVRADSPRVAE